MDLIFKLLFPSAAARLDHLDRLVDTLAAKVGYDVTTDPLFAEVVEDIRTGRDIKAIKSYKTATGSSMGEARRAVAELSDRLRKH